MCSLKNGTAVKKISLQINIFLKPTLLYLKKKYLAVHIITYNINYYENSTKSSKLRIINNSQIYSTIIDTMGQTFPVGIS
jgi:hypothetical protein